MRQKHRGGDIMVRGVNCHRVFTDKSIFFFCITNSSVKEISLPQRKIRTFSGPDSDRGGSIYPLIHISMLRVGVLFTAYFCLKSIIDKKHRELYKYII